MRVLTVSTADRGGGAERIALDTARTARALGHDVYLAVGRKEGDEPWIIALPRRIDGVWTRQWESARQWLESRGARPLAYAAAMAARPRRGIDVALGIEDFHFPGSAGLLDLPPTPPDLVHAHNLHGGYFDLRHLPSISRRVPTLLTLHDAWLLSGHCAHSFDCQRWRTGCGSCPDLTIHPAVRHDATAFNWRRKRGIFRRSQLYVATPSRWLMDKVDASMLGESARLRRVVPNGVDQTIFRPTDRAAARAALGLPNEARVLLFAANRIHTNIWKDPKTLFEAIARVGAGPFGRDVLMIALGDEGPSERWGEAELRFVPYQNDLATVARYYQAADIYVQAARVDTFPTVVLEALACGTPVVATAVGGIPEQIVDLASAADRATGVLTRPGDPADLAAAIERLLADPDLTAALGRNAAADARARFNLLDQTRVYLDLYAEARELWLADR